MHMRGKKPIFTNRDVHNLHYTLSPIIAEGIRRFISKQDHEFAGYPGTDEASTPEEWLVCLNKMLYAFDSKEPEWEDFGVESEILSEPFSMRITTPEAYNTYLEAVNKHIEDCEEGRRLFAKFYYQLWI